MAARQGSFSMYPYDVIAVSVAYGCLFPNAQLWDSITDFLGDDRVDVGIKADGFDMVAARAQEIPRSTRAVLSEAALGALRRRSSMPLGTSLPSDVFPSALRAGLALRALPRGQYLPLMLEMAAASSALLRQEAARTFPYIDLTSDATWAHVLLLQLSYDDNPFVRAEAGFALVSCGVFPSDLQPTVRERVRDLMFADGVRIPLRVVHGLQATSGESDYARLFVPQLRRLSGEHAARVVRGAAIEALRGMGDME